VGRTPRDAPLDDEPRAEFNDPDHARGESDVVCHCIDNDGVFLLVSASYHDQFERRDGVWKIARRDLTLHHRRSVETQDYDAQ
jgi:SnoaL-like domain